MKDYHDLYLKCDILLLADDFEIFKNNTLKNKGLCPSHYLSVPALIWDAMFNMTKVEFELIPDLDMYLFFEKGMRGGVSHVSNRYSKTNNKYLKSYDPKQESKHSIYLDTNNFYGYGMSKFLPKSGFTWIDPNEFDLVDLESPKKLLKLHNGYLLAPDKIEVKREILSSYHLNISDFYKIPIGNVKIFFYFDVLLFW